MTSSQHRSADGHTAEVPVSTPEYALAAAFFDHLRRVQPSGVHLHYNSAARHFLLWLHQCGIPVATVDDTIVDRFQRHQCHCSRYSQRELITSDYATRVRRFIRFLEDRGDIPVVDDIHDFTSYIEEFVAHLDVLGHRRSVQHSYRLEAEHLACWLRLSRIQWHAADRNILERFVCHDCHCPVRPARGIKAEGVTLARRRRGARRFMSFLRDRGVIPQISVIPGLGEEPNLSAFRTWLKRDRGATNETIRRYIKETSRWLAALGTDPTNFTASTIRDIVLGQGPQRSRKSVQMTVTVLRSYLRFLAMRGECRPELVHAVPWVRRQHLATLPRYVNPAVIEEIIATCDISTAIGLRDRAILLLLARLGLRAGDIWQLRLCDVDWTNGLVHVSGKSRRYTSLPLPQDAGDAILAYLTQARPQTREERVFLRNLPPFRPFASASQIAEVVARAVTRSGLRNIPTGAHIFRHSLATGMLRRGANLEIVGALLRHRSQDSTAIYAKVDTTMLESIAQPWPGDASC